MEEGVFRRVDTRRMGSLPLALRARPGMTIIWMRCGARAPSVSPLRGDPPRPVNGEGPIIAQREANDPIE